VKLICLSTIPIIITKGMSNSVHSEYFAFHLCTNYIPSVGLMHYSPYVTWMSQQTSYQIFLPQREEKEAVGIHFHLLTVSLWWWWWWWLCWRLLIHAVRWGLLLEFLRFYPVHLFLEILCLILQRISLCFPQIASTSHRRNTDGHNHMINFTIENGFVLAAMGETRLEGNAAAGRIGEDLSVITFIHRTSSIGLSMVK